MDAKSTKQGNHFLEKGQSTSYFRITDSHFFILSALIVFFTLVVNRYWLPQDWTTSPDGKQFIACISRFYPGLRELQKNWPGYTPNTAALFCSMLIVMPAHCLIGVLSTFYFSEDRREKFIIQSTWRSFITLFMICFAATLPSFFVPWINFHGRRMLVIDQASDSFFVLFYSWTLINGMIFIIGQFSSSLAMKLLLDRR